jgi:methyl-accepting chemotaxis protein
MKNKTFRARLNAVQAVLALLLLIGVGLTWQAEKAHREAVQRAAQLHELRDSLGAGLMQVGDALQALLLDPKNEAERKRSRAAQGELAAVTAALEKAFAGRAKLIETARKLQALHGSIVEPADGDTASAAAYYRKNYPGIQSQRDQLLRDLNLEMKGTISVEFSKTETSEWLALGWIMLTLLGGAVAVWLQSAAVAQPLSQLNEALERMRRGDFTRRLTLDASSEFNEFCTGLNRLADDLSALMSQVQRSGIQVNATATQIAATAKEQHRS